MYVVVGGKIAPLAGFMYVGQKLDEADAILGHSGETRVLYVWVC